MAAATMTGMVLLALTVGIGAVVGWLRGGRLRNLGNVDVRWAWLALVAVVLQLAAGFVPRGATTFVVASQAAVLAFAVGNWLLPGALLIGLGTAMNMAVVLANGAMPVSREALLRAGQHPLALVSARHRLLEAGDTLPWLADVIPLAVLGQVVSAGDVVLAAGVGLLVASLMQRHPPPLGRRSHRSAPVRSDPVDGGGEPVDQ